MWGELGGGVEEVPEGGGGGGGPEEDRGGFAALEDGEARVREGAGLEGEEGGWEVGVRGDLGGEEVEVVDLEVVDLEVGGWWGLGELDFEVWGVDEGVGVGELFFGVWDLEGGGEGEGLVVLEVGVVWDLRGEGCRGSLSPSVVSVPVLASFSSGTAMPVMSVCVPWLTLVAT